MIRGTLFDANQFVDFTSAVEAAEDEFVRQVLAQDRAIGRWIQGAIGKPLARSDLYAVSGGYLG